MGLDMMDRTINIKNMVCPRCVKAIKDLLNRLDIEFEDVILGQATLKNRLTSDQTSILREKLLNEGFELLDDRQSADVENIRLSVIEWARLEGPHPPLSDFLQNRLMKEYSAISKLFSQMKSMTIERFALLQRIEYAKELVSYGEKSLSEIAWNLGFSSPAHFSTQFKKETGMSPKQFKNMHLQPRKFIDKI